MAKCKTCQEQIREACDWRQGRCPHRQVTDLGLKLFFIKLIRKMIGNDYRT